MLETSPWYANARATNHRSSSGARVRITGGTVPCAPAWFDGEVSRPRIVSGVAKGTPLDTPKHGTRPSPSRLREATFNALQHRPTGRFLDLFAGTGAIGLEAASRGYETVLVEKSPRAMHVLRANARRARLEVRLVQGDAIEYAQRHTHAFDVLFAAPPYTIPLTPIFEALLDAEAVKPGGLLLLQHPTNEPLEGRVVARAPRGTRVNERRYGSNTVTWLYLP